MVGIEEGACWDEHWVLYVSDEPRESSAKTKSTLDTLYVSRLDNTLYFKKGSRGAPGWLSRLGD